MSNENLPRWDLGHLYKSHDDPALVEAIDAILPAAQTFAERWRGKIASLDAKGLLEAITHYEEIFSAPVSAYAYAHLGYAADSQDVTFMTLLGRIREALTEAHRMTLFFALELDTIEDDNFAALIEDELLAPYKHYLIQARKQKKYHLTEPEESILTLKALSGKTAFVQLYSKLTSEFKFPDPEDESSEKTLSGSEVLALLKHPDRGVRQKALEIYSRTYEENKTVISSVWNAMTMDHRQNVQLRGYEDLMAPTNEGNELSRKAVDTVMEVTRQNYHLARRYYEWKAKQLGVEKLYSSDLSAPLPGGEDEEISYETAREWVLEGFGAFHEKFETIARGFFDEERIDVPPVQGKSGGAFCMGAAPDVPVYVLLNFTGKMRDAATLAHELGHGIHFTLASKQPFLEYGPVLPLAETASVFGELLMTKKLLERDMTPEARRNLVAEQVEDILATTFRQTMYTDFEVAAHEKTAQGYVDPETFCAIWTSKLDELYGDTVETLDGSRWSWSAIPHFIHTRFYCYAYTLGELLVLALYRRYQEEGDSFAPKMIEFLEAGGSKEPQELVGALGYDLEDPEFWSGGYKVLEEMLEELEKS